MDRRRFLLGGSALLTLALAAAQTGAQEPAAGAAAPVPFNREWLIEEARRLAANAYEPPSTELPASLAELGYDQYRDIRYRPEARIWAEDGTEFELDLLHRGFIYQDRVTVSLVEDGMATPIPFSTSLFDYGPLVPPDTDDAFGFSGFRVRNRINTPEFWDEFLVFQGASYFRAVARGQVYGLSARGLAIDTAEPQGEEFPLFRHFWIERPGPDQFSLIVHALLDSPSTSGAYRFTITPGAETVIDVEGAIFPRQEIAKVGIAPMTSMFLFDGTNRAGFDDFRSAVHDSNGLQILTGAGEWLWRPLANSAQLQISSFNDRAPRGFGLIQRARRYEDFYDLEASYERRPSLWIEPLGDWGDGAVELVEIPTDGETNDNIVAYWRPNGPVPAGGPWNFSYRMRWTDLVRPQPGLLTVQASRMGLSFDRERRLFVIDFAARETEPEGLAIEVSASAGEVVNPVIHQRRADDLIRASFELDPGSESLSELRLRLMAGGNPVSETWLYRWTDR